MFKTVALLSAGAGALAAAKEAFVFLGATGDNALRDNGVWQGLFEAHCGGVFDVAGGVDIVCPTNSPSTSDSLKQNALDTITPLYTTLQANPAWKCKASTGCNPKDFIDKVIVNVHNGFDSCAQAADVAPLLTDYDTISMYMSIPPKVFGEWAECAATNWGASRVQVACEKPFGQNLENADELHDAITKTLPENALHLVDHWLSFFMNKHMPSFRSIVEPKLGIEFNRIFIEKIVVTEFEVRGLEGRGGFFDGVGQVRDMVQSHLLQVMGLALLDPTSNQLDQKFHILNATTTHDCTWGQYEGFLTEPYLTYHPTFADSTYVDVELRVDLDAWDAVPIHIVTGKDFGLLKYTVEFYQRDGPGLLTYEIGKEETGVAGIKVDKWPLVEYSAFKAPVGGFEDGQTITVKPQVSSKGDGYILDYTKATDMYFPAAYAQMLAALTKREYNEAFASFAECQQGWKIITESSPALCMDPPPEEVPIYRPPSDCGNTPPNVCWEGDTVKDRYDVTYACTPEHDAMYQNVSLYQHKCM